MHPAMEYATKCLSGEIVACRWVKLACERFLSDIEHADERGFFMDWDAADYGIEFFGHLRLWKGKQYKGLPFELGLHFKFILSNILGWKWRETGLRRFKTAYIEMGRKGAKSTFAGGVGAYFFIVDGESGAEVYSAATKKDQAKIVWSNIGNLTKGTIFDELIDYRMSNLSIESSWSKCEPLSSDSKSLDGLDVHFGSLDELHAHPTPAVHDLIVDATGARSQPLILIITTAGFDQTGVCFQRREYLTKILKGLIDDPSFFGVIYTLDTQKDWPELKKSTEIGEPKEDDWVDEDLWVKAMPGLVGVTASGRVFGLDGGGHPMPGYMTKIEDVRDKAKYAKEQPAYLNNFLTKRMNIWTQQHTRWISLDLWDLNFLRPVNEEMLLGRKCRGGIDLSSVSDLTCWLMAFPWDDDPERVDILLRCWCPRAKIYDKRNKYREFYQAWERAGFIEATDGDAVDYKYVRAAIVKDARKFEIESIGVDRLFQAYEFCTKLNEELNGTEKEPKIFACGMGFTSMAGPCNELEKRSLEKKINHGGNPVLRFMADSVAVKVDPAGNKKPDKDKSQGKIDGIVTLLLALDQLMRAKPEQSVSVPSFI